MKIYYGAKFLRAYRKLSPAVREKVKIAEKLFREDPFHPHLKTHKLIGRLKEFWAFSVDHRDRIIFQFYPGDVVWFIDVGDHSIYR